MIQTSHKTRFLLRRTIAIVLGAAALSGCGSRQRLIDHVDPFVGTAYTGHTFPGATCPFGFMQPGPQTGNFGWEYCSGYVHGDSLIWGFTQNRLNGTGIPDLGDLLMMPHAGRADTLRTSRYDPQSEQAHPGYYAVSLTDNRVDVALTCTPHVALHRYTYRGDGRRNLFLDLQSGQVSSREQLRDRVLKTEVEQVDNRTIRGYHRIRGWVTRDLYYVIRFDTPMEECRRVDDGTQGLAPKYEIAFPDGEQPVLAKVAFSTVSCAGAERNLEEEAPDWDFDRVRSAAESAWEELLSRVRIEGSEEQKANFYTAMYHLMIQPNNIADVDGSYRGADDQVRNAECGRYFSTFSLWDTFRAAHPFYTLLLPDLEADMVNSMLDHCDVQGFLPIWALWGKENYCMIGNHAVPVVVDACLRGLRGVDAQRAYQAVYRSLTEEHYRSEWHLYDRYGYFPFDSIREESVSRTLECGYDDHCAALLATALGREEEAAFFNRRALYYRNLFDPESKLARGRDSRGNWRTPFNRFSLSHGGTSGGDYTEGNAWQYVWHVPHDVEGLIERMGGPEEFALRLDSLFTIDTRAEVTGFVGDVTGLIGQYAHGNEPSHHVAYLYTLAGRADRTAEVIRRIFDEFYKPRPDGLCGNDDCGQMSAWYLFSAMGFYPVDPASGVYVLGAPQIPRVEMSLPNGRTLLVEARGLSETNRYVASATWNGVPLGKTISYDQIMEGGTLEFVMSAVPVREEQKNATK